MNTKITPNKILAIYVIAPLVLGKLLSDGMGIDVSGIMERNFGVLQTIALADYPTQTKAMSLLIALVLSPLAWFWADKSRTGKAKDIALGDTSTLKLFLLCMFCIAWMYGLFYLFVDTVIDIAKYQHANADEYILPGMRLFLKVASSDFLFSLLATLMISVFVMCFFAVPVFLKVVFIRFQLKFKKDD